MTMSAQIHLHVQIPNAPSMVVLRTIKFLITV